MYLINYQFFYYFKIFKLISLFKNKMSSNIKIQNLDLDKNIEKPLIDLIHYNYPWSNLNYVEIDFTYVNYYIVYDCLNGLLMTKCFTKFENITHNNIDKILCMKIHNSVLKHYNTNNECEIAKIFNDLFNI